VVFDEPGGSFSHVEHIVGVRAAGTVSRFPPPGYLSTVSHHAFTFSTDTATALEAPRGPDLCE
jgi:hypothetical protein